SQFHAIIIKLANDTQEEPLPQSTTQCQARLATAPGGCLYKTSTRDKDRHSLTLIGPGYPGESDLCLPHIHHSNRFLPVRRTQALPALDMKNWRITRSCVFPRDSPATTRRSASWDKESTLA
ncbi:hypothetical protein BaRGS_00034560, partial [Batillaria attramentaria]